MVQSRTLHLHDKPKSLWSVALTWGPGRFSTFIRGVSSKAPTGGGVCTRDGARLEGVEEVRETKIVVGDAVLPRKSHAHIDEAAHPGFQPPTNAARRRVQTRPTASAVLGGAVRDTPRPGGGAGTRRSGRRIEPAG